MATSKTTAYVYSDIRSRIIKGRLSPNESLTEMELASQYNVSRNTIKKALLMLERENLVTIEINKGAKVRAYSLSEVLEYLAVRAMLEGFIVRLVVPVITEEHILVLDEILADMQKNKNERNLIEYSACNKKFHEIIYGICPNRTLVDITTTLKVQMSKYNTKTILIPGRDEKSFSEHSAILNAIKSRDADLAGEMMSQHITNVKLAFEENYSLLF